MWLTAPSMSGGMSASVRGDRYMWRLQPVIDFHEEGRPLQFNDTPAAASGFARTVGDGFRLAGRGGLAG